MSKVYGEEQIFYDDFISSGLMNIEMLYRLEEAARLQEGINPEGASMDVLDESGAHTARITVNFSEVPPRFILDFAGALITGKLSGIKEDLRTTLEA